MHDDTSDNACAEYGYGAFGLLGTSYSSENIWKGNNLIYSNVVLIFTYRFSNSIEFHN